MANLGRDLRPRLHRFAQGRDRSRAVNQNFDGVGKFAFLAGR